MTEPQKYLAASVPRSFRLMRPGLFPPTSIIGTLVMTGPSNGKENAAITIIRDVIMMPQHAFQSMKTNASVNLVLAPTLRLGGGDCAPGFVFTDIREVIVPVAESDPESFAKAYFLEKFGLTEKKLEGTEPYPDTPSPCPNKSCGNPKLAKAFQETCSNRKEKPKTCE